MDTAVPGIDKVETGVLEKVDGIDLHIDDILI
jgi:hypothetical protein